MPSGSVKTQLLSFFGSRGADGTVAPELRLPVKARYVARRFISHVKLSWAKSGLNGHQFLLFGNHQLLN